MDEFRAALPECDRLNVPWGFGFDRVRFVDRLDEQIHLALATKTPVVTVAEVLSASITLLWKMYGDAHRNIEDPAHRAVLFESARDVCLWLLAVQHAFLDVEYYSAVHREQQNLLDQMRGRFYTMDYLLKFGGTHIGKKFSNLVAARSCS